MIFYAKSSKSTVFVKLSATTFAAAKREAWASVVNRCEGVSLYEAADDDDDDGEKTLVAYKEVNSITDKRKKWVNADAHKYSVQKHSAPGSRILSGPLAPFFEYLETLHHRE